MSGRQANLRDYLHRSRAMAQGRLWRATLLDLGLAIAGLVLLTVALTVWTQRGDLLAPGLLTALVLVTLTLLGRSSLTSRRLRRHPLEIARWIATTRTPEAGRGPLSTAQETVLRQEILGAAELSEQNWSEEDRVGFRGSAQLGERYVDNVAERAQQLEPRWAVPQMNGRPRLVLGAVLALLSLPTWISAEMASGWQTLLRAEDARPLPDIGPLWQQLAFDLHYPDHVGRKDRSISNLSGELRAPAGTEISVSFTVPAHFQTPQLELQPVDSEGNATDEAHEQKLAAGSRQSLGTGPNRQITQVWAGNFTLDTRLSWRLKLAGGPARTATDESYSEPFTIELEADEVPEVELLGEHQPTKAGTDERIELRVRATDDFGLGAAELVYQFEDGEEHRLPLGAAPTGEKDWVFNYEWRLEEIPLGQRRELIYWVEVRDNDPGLVRGDVFEQVGKIGKSAVAQLQVNDDEAKHAANIERIVRIRDAAVDALASRLTTRAFDAPEAPDHRLLFNLRRIRQIHRLSEELLYMLVDALDAVTFDPLTSERDIQVLEGVHARLIPLHREAATNLSQVPVGREEQLLAEQPELISEVLSAGAVNNSSQVLQLEDELIRLDDLVDGQLVERLEALVARLQSSQQRLVDLLEQLKAGDESVRPRIAQLEHRIRQDMQRVNRARNQLSKELGHEFVNEDAYRAMEARLRHQSTTKRLKEGDVDGTLESARESLEQIRGLRDQVQEQAGQGGAEDSRLSPEARARMKLLRELSRMEDDQRGIQNASKSLEQLWREAIVGTAPSRGIRQRLGRQAEKLRSSVEDINDARLGREARAAHHDLKKLVERFARNQNPKLGPEERPDLPELFEALRDMAAAAKRAETGAAREESEGKALKRLVKRLSELRDRSRKELPNAKSVLEQDELDNFGGLGTRQSTITGQAEALQNDPAAEYLPEPGHEALLRARDHMGESNFALEDSDPSRAVDAQREALQAIKEAIDSLRDTNPPPPPPPPSGSGDASTAAEQDRSLREQVVEAMKDRANDAIGKDVERYYEELLR